MAIPSVARQLIALSLFALLAGCAKSGIRDSAPTGGVRGAGLPGDAVPRPERRGRYGNAPVYEVFGKRYKVLESSSGYQERGVASWYGQKFHGRLTSNRETYDMHAMTAAHKTLPLPTYVRVRSLHNNKSIIVRVNDRGPFVENRIIDLSYSAALKLDMIRDGTSLVEVTAISFDEPAGDRPTRQSTPSPPVPPAPEPKQLNEIYVQVGAFGGRDNAYRRYNLLKSSGIAGAFIHEDSSTSPTLYRVRIGPIAGVVQYDVLVEQLETLGVTDPYLIAE